MNRRESDAQASVKSVEIQAVVIRANGQREDLGTISYWHRNILKRAMFALKQHFNSNRYSFLRKDPS